MKILKEFRDFAMKGNLIELATAVIIGNEFGKLVSSTVENVFLPPIGLLLGRVEFKDLKFVLQEKGMYPIFDNGVLVQKELAEVSIKYGQFLQNSINFLITAFFIFLVIKVYQNAVARSKQEEAAAPVAPAEPSKEEILLEQIRDALKEKK